MRETIYEGWLYAFATGMMIGETTTQQAPFIKDRRKNVVAII